MISVDEHFCLKIVTRLRHIQGYSLGVRLLWGAMLAYASMAQEQEALQPPLSEISLVSTETLLILSARDQLVVFRVVLPKDAPTKKHKITKVDYERTFMTLRFTLNAANEGWTGPLLNFCDRQQPGETLLEILNRLLVHAGLQDISPRVGEIGTDALFPHVLLTPRTGVSMRQVMAITPCGLRYKGHTLPPAPVEIGR